MPADIKKKNIGYVGNIVRHNKENTGTTCGNVLRPSHQWMEPNENDSMLAVIET